MFGYYGDHMSGWGWIAMTLGMIIFWALVVTVTVLLIRTFGHRPTSPPAPPAAAGPAPGRLTPEQMLAERYARGEIDETEYRNRLEILGSTTPTRSTTTRHR